MYGVRLHAASTTYGTVAMVSTPCVNAGASLFMPTRAFLPESSAAMQPATWNQTREDKHHSVLIRTRPSFREVI